MTPKLYLRDKCGEYIDQSSLSKIRRFFEREIDLLKNHWRFVAWTKFFGLR